MQDVLSTGGDSLDSSVVFLMFRWGKRRTGGVTLINLGTPLRSRQQWQCATQAARLSFLGVAGLVQECNLVR